MFNLVFKKQAEKYYRKLPHNLKHKLNYIFDKLSQGDTVSLDIKPLKGEFLNVHRIRAGNLRIFIEFKSADTIEVLMITPRGDAY